MTDRMLNLAWKALVLGLIVVTGAAALALAYLGLLQLVGKRLDLGAAPLAAATGLGLTAWALARHRNDLVGDRA